MQHVVNRQVIEITLQERDAAFGLQQQVSGQFYQEILPVLGRVFDALGPEGQLVSFDQLVIDVGAVTAASVADGSWTDDLFSKLMSQAEALIRDGGGRKKVVRRPVGAGIIEQWLAYMRTGRLPWNVTGIDAAWLGLLLEHLAADHEAVSIVREAIVREQVVVKRIVEQHDERFLVALAEVLTAKNQAALPGALGEIGMVVRWMEMAGKTPDRVQTKSDAVTAAGAGVLWMAALRVAAEAGAEAGAARTTEEIVNVLLALVVGAAVDAAVVCKQLAGRLSFCAPLLEELERRGGVAEEGGIRNTNVETSDRGTKGGGVRRNEMPESGASERLMERILASEAGVNDSRVVDHNRELAEGIFVPFAGVVLLHPFLGSFFSRLGLVIDNGFVDEAARERGLHLLQYLATGETEMPEYELVMAKVLCAFPIEAPVARVFEPTPEEIEEAGALLDACLSQWTVLQTTSREGLRGSFLGRTGRLYGRDGRLRLEVERSSIDVLLDYLPWNLSLVRLPWMQEMLFVNWR